MTMFSMRTPVVTAEIAIVAELLTKTAIIMTP